MRKNEYVYLIVFGMYSLAFAIHLNAGLGRAEGKGGSSLTLIRLENRAIISLLLQRGGV